MRVIVTEFITLDGVIEEPTPWQQGYESPGFGQFKHDELFESDGLLLGRVTYEEFAGYWPTMEGTSDFADRMNSLPKFVGTTTLKSLKWNATVLEDVEALAVLKRQEGGNLLTYGSGTFVQSLLRHGLVDELRLMVYPLVLGNGKRLFLGGDRLPLKLDASRDLGAGVLLLTYSPAA